MPKFKLGNTPIVLLIGLLLCLCVSLIVRPKSIDLNGVKWRIIKYNSSVLISPRGDVLVGPGCIHLWGKYPYLAGNVEAHGGIRKFVIDVRSYKTSFSSDYNTLPVIGIMSKDMVTFHDLKRQRANPKKLEALRNALTPPKE